MLDESKTWIAYDPYPLAMELHQLRYLRAVLRSGSVTAAAATEHVAQPSISKQIRVLERELGVPLFHRVGRRMVPTDAALHLADCADRVLDDIAATAAALAGPESEVGGSIRVCATETLVDFLIPAALSRLLRELPAASVRVEMLGAADVVARVVADEMDFGLLPLPLVDSRVEVQHLLSEDILAVLPRNHRWAGRDRIDLSALIREPDLLLSMPGMGLRAQVDAAAQVLGVVVRGPIEIRSLQALLTLVAAGTGVTLAPSMSLKGRPDVCTLPIEPPLRREIVWIRRRGRHISAAGTRLIRLLHHAHGEADDESGANVTGKLRSDLAAVQLHDLAADM
jgi:LysR family cyn operon transcriptional activator